MPQDTFPLLNPFYHIVASLKDLGKKLLAFIGLHLKNIFEEEEVDKDATTEEISVVRQEGNRQVTRKILHYNLDAILSVGYRVSSRNATRFRQWFLLFHFTKL